MSEPCPSKERWQEHLNASLPADQEAVLTEHLESCVSCRKTLETLAGGSDSLLDVARQAGAATNASSPALKEIVAQFQAPSELTQAEPSGAKDESLTFLTPSEKSGSLGRLGHYEVQAIIGKGGFGIVLKAFDEKLHRIVAIKVLSPAYAAIGSARKRFIREARAAAAVSHDHVVGIYAVEEEQNPPYIVMQCVDGQSLQDKLDRKGSLSLKEILRIGLQTAEGLTAAHKQGLVHRDIKPANILLENGVERVKITDFGLARAVDDASVTQSGTVAGTPMYMSPEQAEGLPIDHRSDLFSLGTVLYAMCTGHPPFRASGTHAVLKRVIDAAPRPIREINSEIPDWLEAIIAKLHAKKPKDRFQTAKDVAELLGQRLADAQAGRAVPRTASENTTRAPAWPGSVRRRRLIIAAGMAFLFGAVAVAGIFLLERLDQPQEPRTHLTIYTDDRDLEIEVEQTGGHQPNQPFKSQGASAQSFSVEPGAWEARGYKHHKLVRREVFAIAPFEWKKIHWNMSDERWIPLFNGKDLTGWKTLLTPDVWRVRDGILVGGGDKGYLVTEREFENFHFRVEAKFVGKMDSGQWFRFKPGLNQAYEAQIGGDTGTLLRIDAGGPVMLYRYKDNSVPADTWFTQEVSANGNRLTVKLNGETVVNAVDDKYRSGHFALQSFNKQGTVYFRKIEVKELPPAVADQRSDQEKLQGNWRATSFQFSELAFDLTNPLYRDAMKITLEFTGDRMKMQGHNGPGIPAPPCQWDGVVHLNSQASPKQMSVLSPRPTESHYGIYRLDGDSLTLCYFNKMPKDIRFPAEFGNLKENDTILMTFQRATPTPAQVGWVQLFNGKDLTGWVAAVEKQDKGIDPKKAWEVNGPLVIGKSGYGKSYLRTERQFQDFVLKLEYRCPPPAGGRAGISLLGGGPDKIWPKSLQVDLTGTNGFTGYELFSYKLKGFEVPSGGRGGEWWPLEIVARNGIFEFFSKGVLLGKVEKTEGHQGYIGFFTDNREIHFRNVEIKELPPPTTPPLAVAPFGVAKAKEHQDAWAKHLGVDVESTNSIGMKLRLIPPGEFSAGTAAVDMEKIANWRAALGMAPAWIGEVRLESPPVQARLKQPFYLGTYEVTMGQFRAFVEAAQFKTNGEKSGDGGWSNRPDGWKRHAEHIWNTPGPWKAEENHPVVHVSWNDARAFCKWLSDKEGVAYTLPDDQQWEFAARAGTTSLFGDAGDNTDSLSEVAWTKETQTRNGPHSVGSKRANAFGLFDMLGNASEWCLDPFPGVPGNRVVRGGSWYTPSVEVRPARRGKAAEDAAPDAGTGFRVAIVGDLKAKTPPTAPQFVIAGTPRLLKTIDNKSTVRALAFTAEGDTLIAGGDHLTFFDRAKGEVLHQEKLPSQITCPFSLSQDRKTLALVYKDAALVLDLPIRKIPLQAKRGLTFSAALSPDGKTLVYANEKILRFHDRTTGTTEEEARHGSLLGLKYSPDGRFLIGINAKELLILDAKTRDLVAKKDIGPGFGGGVEISQDSKRFVTTGVSGGKSAFYVFSLPDHELQYLETNLAKAPFSLALSPDGNYLAIGLFAGKGGTVQIWDLAQKKAVASWTVAKVLPSALAFSPDGKTLATGSGNFIEVWDLTPQ